MWVVELEWSSRIGWSVVVVIVAPQYVTSTPTRSMAVPGKGGIQENDAGGAGGLVMSIVSRLIQLGGLPRS